MVINSIGTYITLLLFCISSICYGQNNNTILGTVYSPDSVLLSNYSIKLKGNGGRLILSKNFTNAKSFSIAIPVSTDSTYLLEIWSEDKYSLKLPIPNFHTNLKIYLEKNAVNLKEVIVSPDYYKSGDTTYYKPEAYKAVTDQSLGDVLKKIPGIFIIGNDIYYNNVKVGKIKIDGAEIFATQLKLLMDQIPKEALKQIQIIENEPQSGVLKGIDRTNETNINIVTKQGGKWTPTGNIDATVGRDTAFVYEGNLTLLDGVSRIKKGYIGKVENQGNTIDEQSIAQMAPEIVGFTRSYMPSIGLHRKLNSAGFAQSLLPPYIRNARMEHRAQLVVPIARKMSIDLQANIFRDKANQTIYQESTNMLSDRTIHRKTTEINTGNPLYGYFQVNNKINFHSNAELATQLFYFTDKTSLQRKADILQNDSSILEQNDSRKKVNMYGAKMNLYKRKTETSGTKYEWLTILGNINQNIHTTSPQWKLFDSGYDQAYFTRDQKIFSTTLNSEIIKVDRKILNSLKWNAKYTYLNASNGAYLIDSASLNKLPFLKYNQNGTYVDLENSIQFYFKPFGKSWKLVSNVHLGSLYRKSLEPNSERQTFSPTFFGELRSIKKLNNQILFTPKFSYSRKAEMLPMSIGLYALRDLNRFSQYVIKTPLQSVLNVDSDIATSFKNGTKLSLGFGMSYSSHSWIGISKNNILLFEDRLDFVKKPSANTWASTSISFGNIQKSIWVTCSVLGYISNNYAYLQNDIYKLRSHSFLISMTAMKKIGRSILFELKGDGNFMQSQILKTSFKPSKFLQIQPALNLTYTANNYLWIGTGITYLHSNMGYSQSYLLPNFKLQKTFKNNGMKLSASLENLMNIKSITLFNIQSALYSSSSYFNTSPRRISISYAQPISEIINRK